MRPFWRAGILTAALATAGVPLTVHAFSRPDHDAQLNPQWVQVAQKGDEHKGTGKVEHKGTGKVKNTSHAKGPSGVSTNKSKRHVSETHVKSIEHKKSKGTVTVSSGEHKRHRGVRYFWGPGAVFYFYDGYYHGDCSWLRLKAEATGSRYWWRRYRLCRELDLD
jgi:hypothetical protein